ncbi:rod shape-determining protein RodA [Candidatus Wolfebacteria bacterium]|nr:rod shape-determining protein RodA [Candidatus Wolfebacteria bacterium]
MIRKLDWKLNFSLFILMAAGLISLISSRQDLFQKQLIFWLIGLGFIFLIIHFDWRPYLNYKGIIFGLYFLLILFLIITYFFAPTIRGIKGWLVIGSIYFQISELSKLVLIILFAYFFSRRHASIARVSNLIISFIYFFIPAFLIAIQPDFGSALILFCLWFGFLLVSGIKYSHLIIALIIFLLIGGIIWQNVFEDYQKDRISGFLFQERDPLGINYNVIQSKIAIGSAGFLGKGFKQGTQVQLGFLPEAQTDFIFAAFIEEWGLLMGLFILLVFSFLILRIIRIGLDSDNNFNRFICLGAVILLIVQLIFNIGSNLGLTPVVGVTFPFLSYGGSSLLTNLILIGIIQTIFVRRS